MNTLSIREFFFFFFFFDVSEKETVKERLFRLQDTAHKSTSKCAINLQTQYLLLGCVGNGQEKPHTKVTEVPKLIFLKAFKMASFKPSNI